MTPAPTIRRLNLDTFVYDPREGLGQSPEEWEENRQTLIARITHPKLSDEQCATLHQRDQDPASFVPLLIKPHIHPFPEPTDGYYYPVKVGDSYGLQINCAGDKSWRSRLREPKHIKTVYNLIHERHDHHKQPGKIGESWLIWGQVDQDCSDQDFLNIAKELATNLGRTLDSTWNENHHYQCTWQEATLFEFAELPTQPLIKHQQTPQLLICLFPKSISDQEMLRRVTQELYPQLMYIFYYRSKILWIYEQTRKIKQGLKEKSSEINTLKTNALKTSDQAHTITITQRLNQLQDEQEARLTSYEKYAEWLSYLEEYRYALQVNCENYQRRFLRLLNAQSAQSGGFFRDFHDYATEKFIPQVTNDYNTLLAGLNLLDNYLKTTEGKIRLLQTRVEAAQGERDRNIENLIGAAGIGVGVSSAAAGAYANTLKPHETLGLSIGLGLLCGLGVYGILRFFRR